MKTFLAKETEIKRKWYVVDADGKVLGRLATKITDTLRGKNKPTFTPNVDCGDFVIVVNAAKVKLTGKKAAAKMYQSHSMFPGGLKEIKFTDMMAKHPERVIELAVKGMMPKTKLGDKVLKKLKIYKGPAHPHQAAQPVELK